MLATILFVAAFVKSTSLGDWLGLRLAGLHFASLSSLLGALQGAKRKCNCSFLKATCTDSRVVAVVADEQGLDNVESNTQIHLGFFARKRLACFQQPGFLHERRDVLSYGLWAV